MKNTIKHNMAIKMISVIALGCFILTSLHIEEAFALQPPIASNKTISSASRNSQRAGSQAAANDELSSGVIVAPWYRPTSRFITNRIHRVLFTCLITFMLFLQSGIATAVFANPSITSPPPAAAKVIQPDTQPVLDNPNTDILGSAGPDALDVSNIASLKALARDNPQEYIRLILNDKQPLSLRTKAIRLIPQFKMYNAMPHLFNIIIFFQDAEKGDPDIAVRNAALSALNNLCFDPQAIKQITDAIKKFVNMDAKDPHLKDARLDFLQIRAALALLSSKAALAILKNTLPTPRYDDLPTKEDINELYAKFTQTIPMALDDEIISFAADNPQKAIEIILDYDQPLLLRLNIIKLIPKLKLYGAMAQVSGIINDYSHSQRPIHIALRQTALEAFESLCADPGAVKEIKAVILGSSKSAAYSTAYALAMLGSKPALEILAECSQDSHLLGSKFCIGALLSRLSNNSYSDLYIDGLSVKAGRIMRLLTFCISANIRIENGNRLKIVASIIENDQKSPLAKVKEIYNHSESSIYGEDEVDKAVRALSLLNADDQHIAILISLSELSQFVAGAESFASGRSFNRTNTNKYTSIYIKTNKLDHILTQVQSDPELTSIVNLLKQCGQLNIEYPRRFQIGQVKELVRNRLNKSPDGRKLAIVVYPKADWNGAFFQTEYMKPLFDNNYRIMYYEVDTDDEMAAAVLNATEVQKSAADVIIFGGHGDGALVSFGDVDPARGQISDTKYTLDLSDTKLLKKVSHCLKEGGQIIINSCYGGKDREKGNNIANFLRTVFTQAAKAGIWSGTEAGPALEIIMDKDGKIKEVRYDVPTYRASEDFKQEGIDAQFAL